MSGIWDEDQTNACNVKMQASGVCM
jgi:hypothetical protein